MKTCGECIHFLAGAGCRRFGFWWVRFECPMAKGCIEFVDVDEVME